MSQYYTDLYTSQDETRRAGWRHRLEAALRYEVALECMGEAARGHVLDVGCGPGGLLSYLLVTGRAPAHYTGIDRFEPACTSAR